MAKMGRPPRLYVLTTTREGDARCLREAPFVGIRALSAALQMNEALVGQMLSVLGGEFSRKRAEPDGSVLVDHVQRVD
jgi:hypothetical protein